MWNLIITFGIKMYWLNFFFWGGGAVLPFFFLGVAVFFFQSFGWGCCGVAFSSFLLGGVVLSLLLLVLPVFCVSLGGGGFFPLSKWVKLSFWSGVVFQFLPFLVVLFWWCFFALLFCLVGSVVFISLVGAFSSSSFWVVLPSSASRVKTQLNKVLSI